MATKKKLLQAAAGTAAAGGEALNVEDVFSTYLYEGNSSTLTVNNGIDLDGEGGLVWIKNRDNAQNHMLVDTERGGTKYLNSNATTQEQTFYAGPPDESFSFSSTGFSSTAADFKWNNSQYDYTSWTFRKAPKFFDVVTYSGDGDANTVINHNLGSTPGVIITKRRESGGWGVFHRSLGTGKYLNLDATWAATTDSNFFPEVTSTGFRPGSDNDVNGSGYTYVAYLFAHNDGDGDFGPDGDADIIKCGSYTGTGSEMFIDLGFEPQWILTRRTDTTDDWFMVDTMRGIVSGGGENYLWANTTNAEQATSAGWAVNATGFTVESSSRYVSGGTYIYIAIRRGPMAVPTDATEVFDVQTNGGNDPSVAPVYQSGFVTDMAIVHYTLGGSANYPYTANRLMGIQTLETHNTDAEESGGSSMQWDFMNGFIDSVPSVETTTQIAHMWKRAPSYFDVVAYDGSNSNSTVNHNLGVAPEMIWVKRRNNPNPWRVFIPSLSGILKLNDTNALDTSNAKYYFGDNTNITAPTATQFTVTPTTGDVNTSGGTYIAYLFASLDGVSKVGSYTGNGSSQTIDCGFSSGARFVLIKRTDASQHWILFDSTRGIVSGNDPSLKLSDTEAEYSGADDIDPTSSGFIINNDTANGYQLSTSGASYIFYAIA